MSRRAARRSEPRWRLPERVVGVLVVLAALLSGLEVEGAPPWVPAGFGGAGAFFGVVYDRGQPGVLYLLSDVAGVYRSTDGGESWGLRSAGLGNCEITSFAVDPFDGSRLWAGAGGLSTSWRGGIWTSTDAGASWHVLPASRDAGISFRRFSTSDAIAPDPAFPGALLSGSHKSGVFRSTDHGQTWVAVHAAPMTSAPPTLDDPIEPRPTPPYPAPVSKLAFDPLASATVYAAYDGAGVFKSGSRGIAGTWSSASSGLPSEATVKGISVVGGVLFAAVGRAGVYRSGNGGATWQPVNGGLPLADPSEPWVSSVSVDPRNTAIACLTLVTYDYETIWKTTDGGTTWTPRGNVTFDLVADPTRLYMGGYTYAFRVDRDPDNPDRLFYVDYWSAMRSEDGGETWFEKVSGAQNTCVTSLLVDSVHPPGQPDVLYATHWDAALLKSTNAGAQWSLVTPTTWDPDRGGHYWKLVLGQAGGQRAFFTTMDPDAAVSRVLRSPDAVTWTEVFNNPRPGGAGMMVGLAVDPSQPSTLYVLQEGGLVWKSSSGGDAGSWAPTAGQPADTSFTPSLAVDAQGRVFAGTLQGGLFRSTNGGGSWHTVLSEQATVFAVLAAGNSVYAGAGDDNLYRSTDGGDTWVKLTDFAPAPDGDGGTEVGLAVGVDPADPQHLFFVRGDAWHPADMGSGVWESTDGGASWADASGGLPRFEVSTFAFGADGTVFVGTSCTGVYKRVPCAAITVLPASLAGATAGTAFHQSFSSSGGTGAVTYQLAGALPAGLTFSAGALTGTPVERGSFPLSVTATDSLGCQGSRAYTLVVSCGTMSVQPSALPAGLVGAPYNVSLAAPGAVGALAWEIVSGSLPPGLGLVSGAITGTPSQAGGFNVEVRATDSVGCTASRSYSISVSSSNVGPTIVASGPYSRARNLTALAPLATVSDLETPAGSLLVTLHSASAGLLVTGLTNSAGTVLAQLGASCDAPLGLGSVVLEVSDGSLTASASVSVTVTANTASPVVTPPVPASVTVSQTVCLPALGASLSALQSRRPAEAAEFSALLASGTATDDCTAPPTRLTPWFEGADVTSSTLFPVGTNGVTLRFADADGNVGSAGVSVVVRRQGDVTTDGPIDVFDLVAVANLIVGNLTAGSPPYAAPLHVGDSDGNGTIDIFDLVNLANAIVGNLSCLTP